MQTWFKCWKGEKKQVKKKGLDAANCDSLPLFVQGTALLSLFTWIFYYEHFKCILIVDTLFLSSLWKQYLEEHIESV